MNSHENFNPFLYKANKSQKYSNNAIFNQREIEYSKMRQKNISNIMPSKRPYSTTAKSITMSNMFKKKSSNKLTKQFYPSIFTENKSSAFTSNNSKSSTKSKAKNRIHVEDYFHSSSNSKNNPSYIVKSIINMEKYYTPNANFRKNKKKISNYNSYFSEINYINKIYLTETDFKRPEKKKDYSLSDFNDYNDAEFIDYSKAQNSDILVKFMKDKSKNSYYESIKTEYNDKIIKDKNNRINIIRERVNDFMGKTRKKQFDKLALNSKKELWVRIQEVNQNKMEYLEDRIKSFETWKKLNHDFFDEKIGDYLKFLMYKKEYEKNKCEDYLQQIADIKKELNRLESKMSKIEQEKYNILRWVFFQIKLKEKKTRLPEYYKTILENINIIDKYYENKQKKEKTVEFNVNRTNTLTKSAFVSSPKKRHPHKKTNKVTSPAQSSDKEKEKKDESITLEPELLAFLSKEENKAEYLRIKEYKNNLIYKNADEFYERLQSVEQEDLRLIEKNDYTQEKLYQFKQQLEIAKKEKQESNEMFYYNLEVKQNEIYRLKKSNTSMEEIINLLKNNNKYKNVENENENEKNNKNEEKEKEKKKEKIKKKKKSPYAFLEKKIINYKKLLYVKINKLFNICKKVTLDQKDLDILDEKRKLLIKENESLYYFVYIEFCVNYLLNYVEKFKKTRKDGNKILKGIIYEIERTHRMEKNEELRRQLIEKDIRLEYKVNQRNEKIYFLPYRKVSDSTWKKKEKKIIENKRDDFPNFNDFIFDDTDDDIHDIHEPEENKNQNQ